MKTNVHLTLASKVGYEGIPSGEYLVTTAYFDDFGGCDYLKQLLHTFKVGRKAVSAYELIDVTDPDDAETIKYFYRAGYARLGDIGSLSEVLTIHNDDRV